MKNAKTAIPRNFPNDDVTHYIKNRKARDPEFARAYEEGFDEFMLGAMLASAREKVGLTQDELARRVHTSKSAICRWERQPSNMRVATLHKLAKAMGLHIRVKFA